MKSCRLGGRGRRLIDLLDVVVLVTDPPMTMVLMIHGRSACSVTHELSARITGAWGRARPPTLQLLRRDRALGILCRPPTSVEN
jgi:hypothetical protein